jgi:hypothetical protein
MSKILLVRWKHRGVKEGHFSENWEVVNSAARNSFDTCVNLDLNSDDFAIGLIELSVCLIKEKPDLTHFEWFHDFEKYSNLVAKIFESLDLKWVALGAATGVIRDGHTNEFLRSQLMNLAQSKNFKGLISWDYFLENRAGDELPKIFGIPDFQDSEVSHIHSAECKIFKNKKKIHIGVLGQLYAYRGSQLLVTSWLRNPIFRPFLIGDYQAWSHRKKIRILVKLLRVTGILGFSGTWIDGSSRLNHVISHADAVFVDTKNYPYPSGIVIRARQLGIPVIILNADSFLRDLSMIDPGIIVMELSKISKGKLREVLTDGKKLPRYDGATKNDLIKRFGVIWGAISAQ